MNIRKIYNNFLLSGKDIEHKQLQDRYKFFNIVALFCTMTTLPFGLIHLTAYNTNLGIILLIVTVIYASTIYLGRVTRIDGFKTAVLLTVAMFISYMTYNLVYNLDNFARGEWYIFPVLYSFFLLGKRYGVIISIIVMTLLSVVFFNIDIGLNLLTYMTNMLAIFMITVIGYWLESRFEGDSEKLLNINETINSIVDNSTADMMFEIQALKRENEKLRKNNI